MKKAWSFIDVSAKDVWYLHEEGVAFMCTSLNEKGVAFMRVSPNTGCVVSK